MNRQIVKLFGLVVVLFAALIGFTSYWSVFDAKALKEKNANKRPAARAAADQPRPHPRRRRHRDRQFGAQGPRGRVALRAALPGRVALRPSDRLQLRQVRRQRVRAVPQRRAGRQRIGIQLDPRRAARAQAGRQRRRHQPRPGGAVGSPSATSKPPASAPWSRSNRSTGRVEVMASNTPYDPNRVPYELSKLNRNTLETPLLRPRHAGPVPTRLDLQGGDRRGRAGKRQDHPGNGLRRALAARSRRHAAAERLQPELPADNPRHGADQLGQHLVRPARPEARPGQLFEYMEKFGFNSTPPIDLPGDQVYESGVYSTKSTPARAATTRSTSPASRSGRSGWRRRRCRSRGRRHDRQRRPADEAADLEPGGRPRRPGGRTPRPVPVQPAGQRADGGGPQHRDGGRGQRRHRHQRGDRRRHRGRQDGHRGNPLQRLLRRRRPKRTRPGSWASPLPRTRRSRSRRRSSAPTQFGNDVAAPIFRDVAETILAGE